MTIYAINIILIGLYSFIYNLGFKGSNKAKFFFISIAIVQLILLLSLKDVMLGADMPNYWAYYSEQLRWGIESLTDIRFEVGFKMLTKFVSTLTESPQVYLMTIAALSTIPVGFIAYKYSKMPLLTILLYISMGFYAFTFSGLRQSIAMGLILIGYHFLFNTKMLKFFAVMLLAIAFHYSAVAFLIAYPFRNLVLTKIKLLIIAAIAITIFIFKTQLFTLFTSLFYQNYSLTITDSYAWTFMSIAIFLFCLMFYKRVVDENRKNKLLYVIVLIGILMMLFAPVADNVMRIANYFFIFIILLLPEALYAIRGAKIRALMTGIVLVFSLGTYVYLLQIDGYKTVPYNFFWEPSTRHLENN